MYRGGGDQDLAAPQAPPKLEKPCHGQNCFIFSTSRGVQTQKWKFPLFLTFLLGSLFYCTGGFKVWFTWPQEEFEEVNQDLKIGKDDQFQKVCSLNLHELQNLEKKPYIHFMKKDDLMITGIKALHQVINITASSGLAANMLITNDETNLKILQSSEPDLPGKKVDGLKWTNFLKNVHKKYDTCDTKCPRCPNMDFGTRTGLQKHIDEEHPKDKDLKPFICFDCNRKFRNFNTREKHLARKFPERIPDLEKMKKKRCLSCGKEIEEESMKKHFEESCQYEGKCRYCFQMWVQETPEMKASWRVPMIMPLSQAHLIKCKKEFQKKFHCPVEGCSNENMKTEKHLLNCLLSRKGFQKISIIFY